MPTITHPRSARLMALTSTAQSVAALSSFSKPSYPSKHQKRPIWVGPHHRRSSLQSMPRKNGHWTFQTQRSTSFSSLKLKLFLS